MTHLPNAAPKPRRKSKPAKQAKPRTPVKKWNPKRKASEFKRCFLRCSAIRAGELTMQKASEC